MTSSIRFSPRMALIKPSGTLVALARAGELIAQGVDVIDFGPGEPDFDTPAAIGNAAKKAIDEGFTKYTHNLGCTEVRRAIADYYNRRQGSSINAGNVIAGTGGKQELFNVMMALVGPEDEVVIPSPYWVSFPDQVSFAGGRPVFVRTEAADHFRPSARAIEKVLSAKSRGVIINSPCNPTGAVIREDELAQIVELCQRRGLFLVFDETYEFFVYGENRHVSAIRWFEQYPETVICVNSMSKTFSMTGWRLGYAIAHPDIIAAVGKIQGHSTSNPSSISQKAAIEAFRVGEKDIATMHEAYSKRREFLIPALNNVPGFQCAWPDGAFYAFPDVSKAMVTGGFSSSTDFATWLLDEARVAVVPGDAFGAGDFLRLSYATSLDKLRSGVDRIAAAMSRLGRDPR